MLGFQNSNKARFEIEDDESIYVQFNPEQYQLSESANYSSPNKSKRKDVPKQFIDNEGGKFQLSFYLDTSGLISGTGLTSKSSSDVSKITKKFFKLVRVKSGGDSPPNVKFCWNDVVFDGIVTQVSATFTMFESNGMPVQAKVDLSMEKDNSNKSKKDESDSTNKLSGFKADIVSI